MPVDEVYLKLKEIIVESCSIDEEEITLEKRLFDELGIDSIDILDILFALETEYDIAIEMSEVEAKAKERMGDHVFEVDQVVTAEGLEMLRELMPEVPKESIYEGLKIHQIAQLFTVESLCNFVVAKIDEKE